MEERCEKREGRESEPTQQEVMDQFKFMIGDKPYQVTHKDIDSEARLARWEITTTDGVGDRLDIEYVAPRDYVGPPDRPQGRTLPTIREELYLPDGTPCGLGRQFEYVDGEWKEVL